MVAVYQDVIMPASILAAGVSGTNNRKNQRTISQSGFMSANVVWGRTLRRFSVGVNPMSIAQWQALEGLFEVTEGGVYGFLMQDPKDQTVTGADGVLQPFNVVNTGTAGFGFGLPSYRLTKRYTSLGSSRTKDRRISRPRTQTLTRGGGAVTVGAGAGQIAVDATTGTVTFVADASQAMTTITVGATTVLNFATSALASQMAASGRVFVSGVTGTAATTLNNTSHLISSVGATSITISTVTTGLTATGGTAFKYPQPNEALAWTGSFYVPVQFENDAIDFDVVAPGGFDSRLIAGPNVTLVEVME